MEVIEIVRYWYLDKVLDMNTEYTTHSRQALKIERIGTDDSSEVTVKIDNKQVMKLHPDIAPLLPTDSNLLGMLNLGDLYLSVPPDTKIKFEGTSGKHVRIKGVLAILDPNEKAPGDWLSRYDSQFWKILGYDEQTLSLDTDEVWNANAEETLWQKTCGAAEVYEINGLVMIDISGGTVNYGDFGVLFYTDDQLIEFIWSNTIYRGLDIKLFPKPPTATTNYEAFSLKNTPFRLTDGHSLKITAVNVSGSNKAPTSGSNWQVKTLVTYVYEKLKS